ncbi:hypothetical protein DRW03_35255 [Corallococcus sp. H22C18031201]|nr:hypothetical protein DRW03_35255 [Corallococcus sp. H22C18031201]
MRTVSPWPDSLVRAIARQDFILFVGSGVSASCRNVRGDGPPGWFELIEKTATVLSRRIAEERVVKRAKSDLLDAAELLFFEASKEGKLTDVLERIAVAVEGPSDDSFLPGAWHDELLSLDPLLILTTNYDRILERSTKSGFNVIRPDATNVGREIRNGNPTIIKIHGTIDDKQSMVLSHSQYAELRSRGRHMFEVLRALFLTRTCLFVGYSLGDPDIRLLLESLASDRSVESAHYLLGPTPEHTHLKELFRKTYGVSMVEYPRGEHAKGLALLQQLVKSVEGARVGATV